MEPSESYSASREARARTSSDRSYRRPLRRAAQCTRSSVERRVLVVAGDVDEKVKVELAPDEGADRQETFGALGRRAIRRPMTSLTPSGTPSASSVKAPAVAPVSPTWEQISWTKNGLPAVAPDAVHETGPRLDVARVDELPDLALAQAAERDVLGDAVVAEVGDDPRSGWSPTTSLVR